MRSSVTLDGRTISNPLSPSPQEALLKQSLLLLCIEAMQ